MLKTPEMIIKKQKPDKNRKERRKDEASLKIQSRTTTTKALQKSNPTTYPFKRN